MSIKEQIHSRRSVRSFDGRKVETETLQEILRYAEGVETPYALPITWRLLDAKAQNLSCPVVTGTDCFIAGKLRRAAHAEEAFGFAFERVVLFAESLGIGTTWIAGTMDRAAFEHAMALGEGEVMPCVSPLGYPAAKMSLRESMMRRAVKADSRLPFGELFFADGFETPLSEEKAGEYAEALALCRLAPSAVNRQPWRAVVCGEAVHFYEKHSKGLITADGWDTQKIDMGIALCHFACGLEEKGRAYRFVLEDPGLSHAPDTEYVASFLLG